MAYEDLVRLPYRRRYGGGAALLADPRLLEKACVLLRAGFGAEIVGMEIGFPQAPNFTVAFRRATEENPSEWQRARGVKVRHLGSVGPQCRPRQTWSKAELRTMAKRRKKARAAERKKARAARAELSADEI